MFLIFILLIILFGLYLFAMGAISLGQWLAGINNNINKKNAIIATILGLIITFGAKTVFILFSQ